MSDKLAKKVKSLSEKEVELKKKLETSGDELSVKFRSIGKIALVSGLASLLVYWVYKAFFQTSTPSTVQSKSSKMPSRLLASLSAYALPQMITFFRGLFDTDAADKEQASKKL